MNKHLSLLFLLLLSVQLCIAQTTCCEYWLDNGYDDREIANYSQQSDINFDMDISHLKPGLHYFNFRTQSISGQWSGFSRHLFILKEGGDSRATITRYEYWLDNEYDKRTVVEGGTAESILNLDINGMKPGLHYFNFRTQGRYGLWGGLSRYLFFVKDQDISQLSAIRYWIDERNDVMTQQVTDSTVVLTADISRLSEGTHTFYVEGVTTSGSHYMLNGYEFTVSDSPATAEPYAVLSDNNTVLTFYYDDQKAARGGIDINNSHIDNYSSSPYGTATTAVFDASFANYRPTSTAYWFQKCSSLTTITGIEYLNTEEVTDMQYMFMGCESLTSLDVSQFNTTNVTTMNRLFGNCTRLMSIDVSHFNTENLTDMSFMFYGCSSLTSLDVSHFNTANVTDMSYMFWGCSGLTSLNVNGLNTANVTDIHVMFAGCSGLTSLDVSSFNTANVVVMAGMFQGCSGLTSLDLSNFNTARAEALDAMFSGCSSLTSLDLSNFNTQNVTTMGEMFQECSGLTSLNLASFNTQDVTTMNSMFYHCEGLTNLDLSSFNTSNVKDMSWMFRDCTNLKTIIVSNDWSTERVEQGYYMFTGCTSIVGGAGTNYSSEHTDYTYAHIDGGTANPGYFTDKNAPTIHYTFDRNGVLTVYDGTSMADALNAAGGVEEVAKTITAIVWRNNTELTQSDLQGISNPNLLVYVNNASLAPSGVQNVVVNGTAREIVLTDATSVNNNFYVPQAFTAERISYTRNFTQTTQVGVSRGWESIALPFNVQRITHETKGAIAPFGNSASNRHFWLRELGSNGLQPATGIEANTPYVISMPNSSDYTADYNLAGRVTFAAENATIPVTEVKTAEMADQSIVMVPTMLRQERSSEVWALNVGEVRGRYLEGSVFERDYREVRPFEAYTVHRQENSNPAPRYVPVLEIGGTTGIYEMEEVRSKTDDVWYTTDGRKLQGKPTAKGVYINNGQKIVVR